MTVGSDADLRTENEDLRARLDEAEDTLRAIRLGEVDSLVVMGEGGEQVFALKGADQAYRILIENMSEGALTVNTGGMIIYANRRFAEMLKSPLEKIISSQITTWIAPDSYQAFKQLLSHRGEKNNRKELDLVADDDTRVPINLSSSFPILKEMEDMTCLLATDLTEINAYKINLKEKYLIQQRTSAELLIANKELVFQNKEKEKRAAELVIANKELVFQNEEKEKRAAEYKRLATVVQTTTNSVTITDRFAHLIWVNSAFLSTCGYTEDFVIGKTAGSFLQGADTSQDTVKIMREAIKNHKGFDVEILNYKKSGESFWQHIIATPILHNDGSAGYVSIQEDITQRNIINKMKSEFVSTAAHELRTPLTVINGYIELLIMDIGSKDEQREMLSTIHSQSQAMTHLLNEMLDIARIEAQAVGLYQRERQQIGPRLQTLADTFISPDDHNKVTLVLSPNLPEVNVDMAKLEQAIYNCLSNAYKFSPKRGEVTMCVSEVTHNKQRKLLIAIEDQGIGMTPEQLAHVCEKFYRADPSGAIPGTGLGLAITKAIITHHGGTMEIESEYGVGTKVMVYLPVA